MAFNKVILAGNLTRDPELAYTPKGTAVAKFGVAMNRKWTSESGEKKEECTFVDVEAFGKTAETVAQYFKKGKPILVEGRLKLDQWEDKNGGAKRQKLKVILETFSFMGGDKDESAPPAKPATRPETAPAATTKAADPDGDDVPF